MVYVIVLEFLYQSSVLHPFFVHICYRLTLIQSLQTPNRRTGNFGPKPWMVLNTSKCKVLPSCTSALNRYYLGDELVPTSNQEKDLGSIIPPRFELLGQLSGNGSSSQWSLKLATPEFGKFSENFLHTDLH